LRLCVVSPLVDRRHGTERALAEALERLAAKYGCEIHLYAQHVEDLACAAWTAAAPPAKGGAIFWHRVPSVAGPQLLRFPFWLIFNTLCRLWDRSIRGLRCDLVFSPGINCLDADAVIVHAVFHRLRELSNRESSTSADPGLLRRLHRRAYYGFLSALERRIYSNSRVQLAAVSERTAKLLRDYSHRETVRVIPNGVDSEKFSPSARQALRAKARALHGFADSEVVLLLIGNDWTVKGLPAVLEAMAANHDLPFRLLVAGSDARGQHQVHAQRLGVAEHCYWAEPNADPLLFYAAADIYVSPTLEDAFALPPLEAMACGLAVITSINNGGAQVIRHGENGFVLQVPGDAQTLAGLLKTLFDVGYRERIGSSAARTTLELTWDRHADAVWELLEAARAASQTPRRGD
jgi:glycosyltransferase involved in cell wall biosynthesis